MFGNQLQKLAAMMWRRIIPVTLLMFVLGQEVVAQTQQPAFLGTISGSVVDAQTGEALIGVTVALDGTKLGAITDLDGKYIIKRVPAGTYVLRVSMIGYTATQITEVEVTSADPVSVSVALKPQMVETKSIDVVAKAERNNEASLLKLRQKSNSVSDAISAEQISRTGSSDAASAMSRVTGASVVGGKYVFVRGLGDRYANTRINGALAPSPDPDKQAVPMDMIPTSLLDNIVVEKTFTPDKPGNFSGGSVDMTTKDMPESRILTFTSTASYNSQTTFENGVISNQSVSGDWIGNSAENRDIANWLKDPSLATPDRIQAAFARDSLGNVDSTKAKQLSKVSRAIDTKMTPDRRTAPLNQSYGLSYGDQLELFGKPLGFVSSLTYSRSHSYYNNGSIGQRYFTPSDDTLYQVYQYSDEYGKDEVLWGGLINSSYQIHPNHKVGFTYLYNRNSESSARYIEGWNYNTGAGTTYRSRTLVYNERVLNTVQFKGEHAKLPFNARFDWQFAASKTSTDEPDLRSFADDSALYIDGIDTSLSFGLYQVRPSHYFRYLDENNRELSANISLPFKQWSGQAAKFKTGGFYLHKTRDFRERQFMLDPSGTGQIRYDQFYGDADAYFDPANFGILDGYDNTGYIEIGNSWMSFSDPKANYDGTQNVAAVYGMVELPLWSRLTFVGGVRYETTEFTLDQVYNENDTTDLIDGGDLLPSVNLIYRLSENMNLRAAYGRTLARPTLRELAPYSTWEFIGGYYLSGNSDLEYTKIDNYDLRWEWFLRPGEILAVSGFVKQFYNPIERTITSNNYDIHLQNVSRAEVVGIEVEWRRQLDHVSPLLKNFRMGGNFSIVSSKVKLGEFELLEDRSGNPDAPDHRQLMGQSPYIVNADISYDNQKTGTHATLLFNRFGKRLSEVSQGATPDIYEAPRSTVDLTFSQQIFTGVNLRLSGKNLTDAAYVKKYGEYKGNEEIYQQYKQGVTYSIGVAYSL